MIAKIAAFVIGLIAVVAAMLWAVAYLGFGG